MNIVSSKLQTKAWRQAQLWYNSGRTGECEKYQKESIRILTGVDVCVKQGFRIDRKNYKLSQIRNIDFKKYENRFDYTEDFDCIQNIKDFQLFYNLKMICEKGGSQTRSLNLVYDFIESQMQYLLNSESTDKYFINILEGDTSYKSMKYFRYLLNKEKYNSITPYVFIGDMDEFQKWINTLL
jgi:hypothetical protein